MHRVAAALIAVVCCWATGGAPLHAQPSWLSGYLQTAPLFSGATKLTPSNASNFSRFRVTIDPSAGPFSLEAAVRARRQLSAAQRHPGVRARRRAERSRMVGAARDDPPAAIRSMWSGCTASIGSTWDGGRPTGWTSASGGRPSRGARRCFSRRPIPLFRSSRPIRPRVPCRRRRPPRARLPGPAQRDRRRGAADRHRRGRRGHRARSRPDHLAELGALGLGGTLYGDVAGAFGAAGGLGAWAVRAEAVIREIDGTIVGRGTIGLDRAFFFANGRTLSFGWEYQRDGLGATSPDDYLGILQSREFRRGELQVFGVTRPSSTGPISSVRSGPWAASCCGTSTTTAYSPRQAWPTRPATTPRSAAASSSGSATPRSRRPARCPRSTASQPSPAS